MATRFLGPLLVLVALASACGREDREPTPEPPVAKSERARSSATAARRYDTSAVESVEGVVTGVDRTRSGVHLSLDTESGPVTAILGPAWFVDEQRLSIAEGDRVALTGAFAERDGATVLLVAELSKGGETMVLRDPEGRPLWRKRARARERRARYPSHRAEAGSRAWRWRSQSQVYEGSSFDPNAVEKVSGEVVAVELYRGEGLAGVYLKLKTDEGEIVVELGPAWFVGMQEPPIEEGDRVVVTGSRSSPTEIVAMRVRRDGHELWLRDASGRPLWHGWRERGPAGDYVEE